MVYHISGYSSSLTISPFAACDKKSHPFGWLGLFELS